MRIVVAAFLIAALPALSAAQSREPRAPTMGMRSWPMGLPSQRLSLPPLPDRQPVFDDASRDRDRARRDLDTRQRVRDRRLGWERPGAVYLVPGYGYLAPGYGSMAPGYVYPTPGYDYDSLTGMATVSPFPSYASQQVPFDDTDDEGGYPLQRFDYDEPPMGMLQLEVEPQVLLELYVDGYYIGMARDFDSQLMIGAGPHTVELRADGFEAREIDIDVVPDRALTLYGSLAIADEESAEAGEEPATAAAPRKPMTFYYIPGCYGGNVPPKDAGLPPGCDPRKVITRTVGQ